MACTPLDIQAGLFLTSSVWETTASKSFDGKTVTRTTSGPNPGITVEQGPNHLFHPQGLNRELKYMVLGNKFLVILDMETGAGPSTRRVSLVNFATWSEEMVLTVLASSNAVALPIINPSQGSGAVFLGYGQDGTQHTSVAIYRSDNADVLCSLGSPIIPTGQTAGEATATKLIIHYSTGGTSKKTECLRPRGECDITPSSQSFPQVAVGGCPFTPPTKQFTIKNVGDDCLTVSSISNNPPFSVQSTSKPLPAELAKNETVEVTVAFNPTSTGDWNLLEMAVATSPANASDKLVCSGEAVSAQPKIQFSATTFNFGKHPVGTPAPGKMLTITNTGSKPLTISVPVLAVSGFTCAGFNGTLNCGDAQTIALGFTPASEGNQSATLSVTSNASGSPHAIQLLGQGCVANAEIVVPPTSPIGFGQVQQGFRTVRFFEVQNTGDGPLTFTASISGPDAALFGLPVPAGSVTDAPPNRSYTVSPVSPCGGGPSGSGKAAVAVSFFANDTPKLASATLTLSGHDATNAPAGQTWSFPLSAEITPPVALDVALVIDRSGSMNDPLGSREKMGAAISAGELFVELLRADLDDRVAVVRFNHLPEVIVPMTPVSTTASPTKQEVLLKIGSDIRPADGNTAIAAGAITGIREVEKPRTTTPPQLTRAVVVLSDGKENTGFEDPPGSGDWVSILGGEMMKPLPAGGTVDTDPMTAPSNMQVYAIGLGTTSDIDASQLTQLATAAENFYHVDTDLTGTQYFELEKYYTQIFMEIVGTSSVSDPMYWISPGQKYEIEFDVLRGDVDALVVVYDWQGLRLPFYCLSPRGEIVDPAVVPPGYQLRPGVTSQARFVELKMPLKEPDRYAGRWKVVIEHPGEVCTGTPFQEERSGAALDLTHLDTTHSERQAPGFLPPKCRDFPDPILFGIAIGVGSNFRMVPLVTPGPVYVGEPIRLTALVSEAGLPVKGCAVTVRATSPSGMTRTLVLHDDGAHSDGAADDGEYANTFMHTSEAGTYHFHFRAVGFSRDGEPVTREALRDKPVLPRKPADGGGRPDKGDECCRELLDAIQEQTRLLKRAIRPGRTRPKAK